jgi:hypothetical protein
MNGVAGRSATILVRHSGARVAAERLVRRELDRLDRGVAVDRIRSGEDVLRAEVREVRIPVLLLVGSMLLSVMLLLVRLGRRIRGERASTAPRVFFTLISGIVPGAWIGHRLAETVSGGLNLPALDTLAPTYVPILGITTIAAFVIWRITPRGTGGDTEPPRATAPWTQIHPAR